MEELAVRTGADLINGLQCSSERVPRQLMLPANTYGGIQIDEDRARDVFATTSLGEEGLVGAGLDGFCLLRVGATILFQAMLEKVPGRRRRSDE